MSTHNIIINIKNRQSLEIITNTKISAAMGLLLLGTPEQVQNSRGK